MKLNRYAWTALESKIVSAVRLMEDRNGKVHPSRGIEFVMVTFDANSPLCDLTVKERDCLSGAPHLIVGLNPDGATGFVEAHRERETQEREWLAMDPLTPSFVRPHSSSYVSLDNRLFALQLTKLPSDLEALRRQADVDFLQDRDSVAAQKVMQIEAACEERGIAIQQFSL